MITAMTPSRRTFLQGSFASAVAALPLQPSIAAADKPADGGTPMIHVTDLFHPHGDPDDHFDLACAYALALRGDVHLEGIVIDYPPDFRAGDPAAVAVAQLNWLSGLAVPVAIGTPRRLRHHRDALEDASRRETAAAAFLLHQLRTADRAVAIVCVGSAADIVAAAIREPELFKTKCAGVYLNSGSAHDDPARPEHLEFNVRLDPVGYAAMFDLPCPLYWFPCWNKTDIRQSGPAGSFYWLPHRAALSGISDGLANYFTFMFEKSTDPKWLRAMNRPPAGAVWRKILDGTRGMWSTASQFAAAGLTVTRDGTIAAAREAGDDAVFRLRPGEVTCTNDGRTTWRFSEQETDTWILSITDPARYSEAMPRAVASLLAEFR